MLFLSIRPQFAHRILSGSKTVEFRRTRPRADAGQLLVLYASSPEMRLVGFARVAEIVSGPPTRIWSEFGACGGIPRSAYRTYFAGAHTAHAIRLDGVEPLRKLVPLEAIRKRLPRFHPPQAFAYLSRSRLEALGVLAPGGT